MATVKYNEDEEGNKRIILKSGKVSCSCCVEPECCMYPATAFAEDIYTADDLPNEVIIAGVLAYKQGDGFPRYLSNDGDFYINDPSEDTPPEDATWNVTIFGQSQYVLDCLISSYEGSSPQGVEDQFADTYTIEFYNPPPNGAFIGTTTATRVSLCVWQFSAIGGSCGEGETGFLFYENTFTDPARLWRINIAQCDGGKQPFDDPVNNTPLGIYASADGEWRVV